MLSASGNTYELVGRMTNNQQILRDLSITIISVASRTDRSIFNLKTNITEAKGFTEDMIASFENGFPANWQKLLKNIFLAHGGRSHEHSSGTGSTAQLTTEDNEDTKYQEEKRMDNTENAQLDEAVEVNDAQLEEQHCNLEPKSEEEIETEENKLREAEEALFGMPLESVPYRSLQKECTSRQLESKVGYTQPHQRLKANLSYTHRKNGKF